MRKIFIILFLIFFIGLSFTFAQEQRVSLMFFIDMSGELRIVNETGDEEIYSEDLMEGDEIPVGWTIVTGNGDTAELIVEPSGTIIKIAENTNFKVSGLQDLDGAESNEFILGFGQFRAIAAQLTGIDQYKFYGETSVCGVRGTDFGMLRLTDESGNMIEEAFCFSGEIEYTQKETGKSITLGSNQFASSMDKKFEPKIMPEERIEELKEILDFEKVKPEEVPGHEIATEPIQEEMPLETPEQEILETPTEIEKPKRETAQWVKNLLNFKLGTLTLDDQIYAEAVFMPRIITGRLKMAFYVPIIYMDNLFDVDSWYRPAGNNEWSFGTDQHGDIGKIFADIWQDFVLKIHYIQFGEQRDKFHFKLGNINEITIGHGLFMRNFANDLDFPSVRRLGINMGLNITKFGLESVVEDVAKPEIFGGRIVIRPFAPSFPIGIGLTGLIDWKPLGDMPDSASDIGDPIIMNFGADLDYPLIEKETFNLVLFTDFGLFFPYYRDNVTSGPYAGIEKGMSFRDSLKGFKNIGSMTGLLGRTGLGKNSVLDWRADFRLYNGVFKPSYMDGTYERLRNQYAYDLAEFTLNADDDKYKKLNMGIYGELKGTFLEKFFVAGAYEFPISIGRHGGMEERDYFYLAAGMLQTAIPRFRLGFSVSYSRYYFWPWIRRQTNSENEDLAFFDKYSIFRTTIIYGVTQNVDLSLVWTTTADLDSNGDLQLDDGEVETVTTLTIEMFIHF